MKKRTFLYMLWGFFYVICGLISNVEQPDAAQKTALVILSLIFFIPPVCLLVNGLRRNHEKTIRVLRLLSILSLSLTLAVFVANIAVVGASETVGNVLYQVLIWVSVPMVCSQVYVLSLFLWGCLLFTTLPGVILPKRRKKK